MVPSQRGGVFDSIEKYMLGTIVRIVSFTSRWVHGVDSGKRCDDFIANCWSLEISSDSEQRWYRRQTQQHPEENRKSDILNWLQYWLLRLFIET